MGKTREKDKLDEVLDELLKDCKSSEDIVGKNGLLKDLSKRLFERALQGEMTAHLGYEPNAYKGRNSGDSRNGVTTKTVATEAGEVEIEVPRDRNGSFEPQIVKKHQKRVSGIDKRILSLYAKGMTVSEIQSELEEAYGTDVSPALISNVTDSVMEDVKEWQSRPLSPIYPILYFDALVVKSREEGPVKNKAVYLALGVNLEGKKELLGLWTSENEGSRFWLSVFNDLKNRGVNDCFIACVDGLKGLPEAIETVFPKTQVQLCIVHKVRNSLKYVSNKEMKEVASDLKAIYGAATLQEAETKLGEFSGKWDKKYPAISPSWKKDWDRLTVFFDYPPEIRKVIYTTNAIESLNYTMRMVLKKHGAFPNDGAILKVMWLALDRITKKWTMPLQNWKAALNQMYLIYGGRFEL